MSIFSVTLILYTITYRITMLIKDAKFVISSADVRKCPEGNLPEYAFKYRDCDTVSRLMI